MQVLAVGYFEGGSFKVMHALCILKRLYHVILDHMNLYAQLARA